MFATFNLFWTRGAACAAMSRGTGRAAWLVRTGGGGWCADRADRRRLGDRGYVRTGTRIGAGVVRSSRFLIAGWAGAAHTLIVLALAAVLLDAATQLNQVLGQRVTVLDRARGARADQCVHGRWCSSAGRLGSTLASFSCTDGGWTATTSVGGVLAAAALVLFLTEPRGVTSSSGRS